MVPRFDFTFKDPGYRKRDVGLPKRYPRKMLLKRKRDIGLLKKAIKNTEFELKDFITNSSLALYFNVYNETETFCYIYRGWDDPGFRIGAVLVLNKNHRLFKENFRDIFKICSHNMVSIAVNKEDKVNCMNISLEIGIYDGGLNRKVLKKALQTLWESIKSIRPLLSR